ncbi:LSU ribosomal protein L9P [Chthonomonas calidirosea]|uniref:Large ribosomal subunit protein bL9 n=1 Tax=Chthonomonas calidirosea (strain DSM 23976 / ICMP 18418 / T49) TaxID=1303518 RepID=S0EUT9_CHTCT|nr:50S ribosomal protein L9 [Chthonomonas calidirosea]CCW35139.1 LSU ribosomal protein L9P [Chthonomonas calidirosea T49]CEK20189.1 LSU ribosomal protein L9P [Chthonomonas calidirosea]CEK20190.1 LSU ribosomal protein L9P [Chthonomonas calidirosea]CEK20845.1 LSU ribosomal protein L9P [Chthonomonas calidirosea]
MKVILTRDVPKLGQDGDIVNVADGYARNYLFPRRLAVLAHGAALKQHQARLAREKERGAQALEEAKRQAEKLNGAELEIIVKTSPNSTRLFGSVTEADVAEQIQQKFGITVDKRKIGLVDPIRTTGRYEIGVRLHPEVRAQFVLYVLTEEQRAEREKERQAAASGETANAETAAAN